MTIAGGGTARLEMGHVVLRTVEVIRRNVRIFIPLSLVVGIPAVIVEADQTASTEQDFFSLFINLPFLVFAVSYALLEAGIAVATVLDLSGRRASLSTSAATMIVNFFPVVVIGIINSFASVIGLALLVIPYLIFNVVFAVLIPVRVMERTSVFRTFLRCRELTRGHGWPILGLITALLMLTVASEVALNIVTGDAMFAGYTSDTQSLAMAAVGSRAILDALDGIVGSALTAVLYHELRRIKDGIGPEGLASVFD